VISLFYLLYRVKMCGMGGDYLRVFLYALSSYRALEMPLDVFLESAL
jgi:hypothetical protein